MEKRPYRTNLSGLRGLYPLVQYFKNGQLPCVTAQKTISSQAALRPALSQLKSLLNDSEAFWQCLENEVLVNRVKFPVLEHLAVHLNNWLEENHKAALMKQMADARYMSSYPVIGKLLQLKLPQNLVIAYDKAVAHIIQGDEWYVCDIISERVFGEGTLKDFDQSLDLFKKMGDHENFWIQRSIGIAAHYATKKKLPKDQVEELLLLMLNHAYKTQYFTKKGIGWAGKTIAKYHPDLIRKHETQMKATSLSRWFIGKVNTGLSMAKSAPFVYE